MHLCFVYKKEAEKNQLVSRPDRSAFENRSAVVSSMDVVVEVVDSPHVHLADAFQLEELALRGGQSRPQVTNTTSDLALLRRTSMLDLVSKEYFKLPHVVLADGIVHPNSDLRIGPGVIAIDQALVECVGWEV